jgi:hypothetical protein
MAAVTGHSGLFVYRILPDPVGLAGCGFLFKIAVAGHTGISLSERWNGYPKDWKDPKRNLCK